MKAKYKIGTLVEIKDSVTGETFYLKIKCIILNSEGISYELDGERHCEEHNILASYKETKARAKRGAAKKPRREKIRSIPANASIVEISV